MRFRLLAICAAVMPLFLHGMDTPDVDRARAYGAVAKGVFVVTDSANRPVSNATVTASFLPAEKTDIGPCQFIGTTDKDGRYAFERKIAIFLDYVVEREGFYPSTGKFWYYRQTELCAKDGKWLPWDKVFPVTLKERRKPIAMCWCSRNEGVVTNQTLRFDCLAGDWLPPNGKGTVTDFKIDLVSAGSLVRTGGACQVAGTLSADSPSSGFLLLRRDGFSKMDHVYVASTNGHYLESMVFRQTRDKTGNRQTERLPDDAYLVYRSRVVTDSRGSVIHANYGIINKFAIGFREGHPFVSFETIGNPHLDDMNLEYDSQRNLLDAKSIQSWKP